MLDRDRELMASAHVMAVGAASDNRTTVGYSGGEFWRHFTNNLKLRVDEGFTMQQAFEKPSTLAQNEVRETCPPTGECVVHGSTHSFGRSDILVED